MIKLQKLNFKKNGPKNFFSKEKLKNSFCRFTPSPSSSVDN